MRCVYAEGQLVKHPNGTADAMNYQNLTMKESDSSTPETTKQLSSLSQLCKRGVNYIRENPAYAVAGSLAAGLVVGWLLPHREPTWQERYVAGPMGKAKQLLHAAAESASEGMHTVTETASDAAGHAGDYARKLRKYLFS